MHATTHDRGVPAIVRRGPGLPVMSTADRLITSVPRISVSPAQPELDRIEPCRHRELVGEALDSEAIGRLPGRADWRGAQRGIFQPVDEDLDVIGGIGWIGVLPDKCGLEAAHVIEPGGCRGEQWNIGQSRRRLRQPHLRAPPEDASVGPHHAGNIEQLRRAFGIPAVLIFSRPLYAHRAPDRTRQDRGSAAASSWPFMP